MKSSLKYILIFCLLLTLSLQMAAATPPQTQSRAAVLINADTGQVLYQSNAETPLPPASTTKIMTGILVLEDMNLTDTVNAGPNFVNPGGSHIAIDHEEVFTVKDLLYALLVESANDAAAVLANAHSGSVEAFVEKMNGKAQAIGATTVHFDNPHGLDSDTHLMSAKDLALISAYAMENATFREIVKTLRYTIPPTNKKNEAREYITNGNLFLLNDGQTMNYDGQATKVYDQRVDGVKTGYTDNAKNCLVSSFTAEGARYIVVVLGAGGKDELYGDSKRLIDYAINNFERVRIVAEGEIVHNIKVKNAESTGVNLVATKSITRSIPVGQAEDGQIEHTVELYDIGDDQIIMGTPLGKAIYTLNGQVIATVELVSQRDVASRDLLGEITNALSTKPTFNSPIDVLILLGKIALVLLIWRWLVKNRRRRLAKIRRSQKLKAIREGITSGENVVSLSKRKR